MKQRKTNNEFIFDPKPLEFKPINDSYNLDIINSLKINLVDEDIHDYKVNYNNGVVENWIYFKNGIKSNIPNLKINVDDEPIQINNKLNISNDKLSDEESLIFLKRKNALKKIKMDEFKPFITDDKIKI